MKKIIYTCDECHKEIDIDILTLSYAITDYEWEIHFCGNDCMRNYLTRKWDEQDREKQIL